MMTFKNHGGNGAVQSDSTSVQASSVKLQVVPEPIPADMERIFQEVGERARNRRNLQVKVVAGVAATISLVGLAFAGHPEFSCVIAFATTAVCTALELRSKSSAKPEANLQETAREAYQLAQAKSAFAKLVLGPCVSTTNDDMMSRVMRANETIMEYNNLREKLPETQRQGLPILEYISGK